ncbi:unnamed protein product, partial [Leptidea sinapis]
MHRLMSARNVNQLNLSSINNLQNTLVHKTAAVNEITCSFCRQVLLDSHTTEKFILARHQSTNTASALRSLKKKGKHKAYKKYGELLEVSGANTTESKVSISKLHASHLSKLASSPISLGQLHQLTKPVKKTKSIEVDPELLETVKKKILKKSNPDSNLADDKCALVFTNHKISSLEYKLRTKHYLDSVKQSYYNFRKATLFDQRLTDLRYAINEGVTQELDFDAQSISGNDKTILKSPHSVFRELFVENNSLNNYDHDLMNQITMLQQAELKQKRKKRLEKRRAAQEGHKVLKHYRQRCANARHLEHPCVRDVKIYNTLLHGYASIGKLDSVRELLSYMSEDGITMDAQTYAAVFECVERSDLIEKEAVLNIYHKQMMDKGIQLNDLLAKTKFLFDQREVVLKAVRRIEENFTPHYEPPPLDYNCPLLEKLKLDNIENRMGLVTSPASGLLTLDEMKTLGKQQLELELKGEMDREKLSVAEKEWREVIRDAFVRNLSTLKSRSNASHSAITLYPYLKVLQVQNRSVQKERSPAEDRADIREVLRVVFDEEFVGRHATPLQQQANVAVVTAPEQRGRYKKLPALYKVHRPWGRLVRLELKPHPTLTRLCAAAARPTLSMRACLAPTLSPPVPWRSPASAAYLLTETPLISSEKFHGSSTKEYWTYSSKYLEPANSFRRRLAFSRAKADMHSLWCDSLYKLSLANHYRDRVFWLPHNMDFRGRVYAVSPHVSVLGADAARSLLVLAQKRKLGARGLRWLKLHAVNLTGALKRQTIDERLEYAESIMEKILDSADNPLDGEGWWKESEEPWQTLACCVEIANAVRSPNPEEYECGFPVHQDGSCNGLQHYAALGGDAA